MEIIKLSHAGWVKLHYIWYLANIIGMLLTKNLMLLLINMRKQKK